jgi:protein arginine kinase
MIHQQGAWLAAKADPEIAVSSRVRLARNIKGQPFPGWAEESKRLALWCDLSKDLGTMRRLADSIWLSMDTLDPVDRQVLRERHLISAEFGERGKGSGIVIRRDESISVMINEEDHFRMQAMSPGLNVLGLWREVDALDSDIEERIRFAFSPRLGYLTACPTNVGTGLRASVMLHLAGLRLVGEIDPVIKGLSKIGLNVRGLMGEGTEAFGNMFQISNQGTLGETEEAILQRLVHVVEEVIEHERNARARLMEQKEELLRDRIGRAFGILLEAHVLSSGEALDLLSALRLGVELRLVKNVENVALSEMMLLTQAGHLQKMQKRVLAAEERDVVRARIMRDRIRNIVRAWKAGDSPEVGSERPRC